MIGQVDKTYQGSSRVLQKEEGQGSGAGPGRCAGRGATPDHQKVRGALGVADHRGSRYCNQKGHQGQMITLM